ncbi:MAG: SnoaL-like protein [Ignavibacteria bacterium]|nr:SnoaL-like protein [Ignavibacteria bacterium]
MHFIYIFLISCFVFSACCPEPKALTAEEISKEEAAAMKVCDDYNKASQQKNWAALVETLAGEVIFFGTDSAEIIKTFAEFKIKMLDQWKRYDKMVYGKMTDASVQMDKNATFASVIFGVPVTLTTPLSNKTYFLRVSRTLKKEKEKWVIVSGIVGVAADLETRNNVEAK